LGIETGEKTLTWAIANHPTHKKSSRKVPDVGKECPKMLQKRARGKVEWLWQGAVMSE
jgi:hypothetical protein